MKFKYKKVASDVFRPIIPIEVGYKDFFVNYEILIDSGADECIFDGDIGELIGLKIESGEKKKVYGVTSGSEIYYRHDIVIKVGGWPHKIKAGFLPNLSSRYNYGIVGQKGFFDIFVVRFDLLKSDIELFPRK